VLYLYTCALLVHLFFTCTVKLVPHLFYFAGKNVFLVALKFLSWHSTVMGQHTSHPSGWRPLPALYASSSTGDNNGDYNFDQRIALPIASNVVGYSLFRSSTLAGAESAQTVEVSMWGHSAGSRDDSSAPEQLVSQCTLSPSDLRPWHGWKVRPSAPPPSFESRLRCLPACIFFPTSSILSS
jgi:hypothetical protein